MADQINLKSDQRKFTIIYNDFLESNLLDWNEKRIFIYLKKFSNSEGQSFPSINTLARLCQMNRHTVIRALQGLEEKKIIKIEHRTSEKTGGQISNLYTIYDYKEIWEMENAEQLEKAVDIDELRLFELAKEKGYKLIKEKEPISDNSPSKATEISPLNNQTYNKDTTTKKENQEGNYSLEQIREKYEYDHLIMDLPEEKDIIDAVMTILYDTYNRKQSNCIISGEKIPTKEVIKRLGDITVFEIKYVINIYTHLSKRVKNPSAYMLTMLYNAKFQMGLDMANIYSVSTYTPDDE